MSENEEVIELTDEVVVKKSKKVNFDQMLTILSQPSTWKGFVLILGVIGVDLDPDQMVTIAKAVASLYGTIAIIADKN